VSRPRIAPGLADLRRISRWPGDAAVGYVRLSRFSPLDLGAVVRSVE